MSQNLILALSLNQSLNRSLALNQNQLVMTEL